MKDYKFSFECNLYTKILIKAHNKADALEIARDKISSSIYMMLENANENENNIEFQDSNLQIIE